MSDQREVAREAVVPAGGRGTRMRPVSYVVPKELLPVALRPMLDHCVREAAGAGLRRICIVVSPDKEAPVREYFERVPVPGTSIDYRVQPEPRGLMDAVHRAKNFVTADRFAVLLPDNLFPDMSGIGRLLDLPRDERRHVIGLVSVDAEAARALGARGALDLSPLGDAAYARADTFVLNRVGAEKRPVRVGPDDEAIVNVGRYIFDVEVFDRIEATALDLDAGEELDDLPILNRFAEDGRLVARLIEGEYHDVGNPIGYWRANARLGPKADRDAVTRPQ